MGRTTFFAMAHSRARIAAIAGPLALGFGVFGAVAQDHDHSHMHTTAPDARQLLDFPPPMREHMLANMRSHLKALQSILATLAANEPAKAGAIADTRLGLGSPGAAICNPKSAKGADMMASTMGEHMPEQMRAYGFAMHEAASNFAAQAAKLAPGGDPKPALAALADVTERCAACHAAYRLR